MSDQNTILRFIFADQLNLITPGFTMSTIISFMIKVRQEIDHVIHPI
jgi:hypothetical protein